MGEIKYSKILFDRLNFTPTELQAPVFTDQHRVRLVAGGWRAGKSFIGAKDVVLKAPRSKLIWLIGKNYDMCDQEFQNYIVPDLLKLGMVVPKEISTPKQGQMSLTTVTGCRIETRSAEDLVKIGQSSPDFILVCEAAQIPYEAYLRIRGRVMESKGSILLTGTFENDIGWYVDMFQKGQGYDTELKSFSLPSWSNTVVFPHGRTDPEILKAEEELGSLFKLYCAAIPSAPAGIILPEFSNAIHVGDYPYDPDIPVEIAVDPGYGGAYAVLAIQIKETIPYIVDEIYQQGYVTEDIITMMKQKPWGNRVRDGAIDVAGKQHQAMAAPIEVWQEKTGLLLKSQWVDVEGGIDLLRTFLSVNPKTGKPKVYINSSCNGIISECGGGKSPVLNGGAWVRNVETGKIIDRNNHACKAFIYWLVSCFGYAANNYMENSDRYKLFKPGRDGSFVSGRGKWALKKTISAH